MAKSKKVLIIGWDCAPPDWVFDKWSNDLPTLVAKLVSRIATEAEKYK